MRLQTGGEHGLGRFRCPVGRGSCKQYAATADSFFHDVHLPLHKAILLMYCFARDFSFDDTMNEVFDVGADVEMLSSETIAAWFRYCREMIVDHVCKMQAGKPKLGGISEEGSAIVVQIDEAKFGKRKYNRGRIVDGHWVLGMVDTVTTLKTEPTLKKLRRIGDQQRTGCGEGFVSMMMTFFKFFSNFFNISAWMQQQQKKIEIKTNRKRCSMKGCRSEELKTFNFPSIDKKRMVQWVEACDNPNLSLLPPEKLKFRIVYNSHFEKKYIIMKKLTTSAVPTLNLPVPEAASIKIEQQDSWVEIKEEEEEECKPDCIGGMDTTSSIVGHLDYTALPGPSREMPCNDLDKLSLEEHKPLHNADCVVPRRQHQRSAAQEGQKGNILKMLRESIAEREAPAAASLQRRGSCNEGSAPVQAAMNGNEGPHQED